MRGPIEVRGCEKGSGSGAGEGWGCYPITPSTCNPPITSAFPFTVGPPPSHPVVDAELSFRSSLTELCTSQHRLSGQAAGCCGPSHILPSFTLLHTLFLVHIADDEPAQPVLSGKGTLRPELTPSC